jgi:asparaginase
VHSDKPVAVVGSMRNPSTLGYEGAANLVEGFRVAASSDARGKGELVALNDEINAAREVTKTDALRLNTSQTRGYGELGVVDADRVVFYRTSVKRHTAKSEFDIASVTRLPRVDVLLVYQGADGDLIKAAADAGARGIIRRCGRGRDERHAAGWRQLRAQEGRHRRDDDESRQRTHRATAARSRRGPVCAERCRGQQPADAGGTAASNRRRRSGAGESAGSSDARVVAHERPDRDPASVHRILTRT